MKRYLCNICGYVYEPLVGDPEGGESSDTAFKTLPDDWVCPNCSAEKRDFEVLENWTE